jgi:hypothetical protein
MSLIYQLMEKIVSLAGFVPRISASIPSVILSLSIIASVLIAALEYRRRAAVNRLVPFS